VPSYPSRFAIRGVVRRVASSTSWIIHALSISVSLPSGGLLAAQRPRAAGVVPTPDSPLARRIARVERGLRGAITLRGIPTGDMSVPARMRHHRVSALGVAVVDGFRLAWARGYGTVAHGSAEPVTTTTAFQAGSISKPVAAVGALRLVEAGRLRLDAPIDSALRTWRMPSATAPEHRPVSLRDLLTHGGSITVHGFPGYPRGTIRPTLHQVLAGAPPANTPAILRDGPPGVAMRYSGGGFTILQQAVEDVTSQPFARYMEGAVLRPVGMRHSTFASLEGEPARRAALGHRADGVAIPGGWHEYPEQAAASLWSTPSDLARLVAEIERAHAGRTSALMRRETAREMSTAHLADAGLGVFVKRVAPAAPGRAATSPEIRFSHTGGTEGYASIMIGYPERGQGIVVMTNSDAGGELAMEVVRAVAAEYGWSDLVASERTVVPLAAERRAPLVGAYDMGGGRGFDVTEADGELRLALRGRGAVALYADSDSSFFAMMPGAPDVRFERDASGRATALVFRREDQVVRARRRE
jgi:CubicO group peptidase (beta-lactamase class C family)